MATQPRFADTLRVAAGRPFYDHAAVALDYATRVHGPDVERRFLTAYGAWAEVTQRR